MLAILVLPMVGHSTFSDDLVSVWIYGNNINVQSEHGQVLRSKHHKPVIWIPFEAEGCVTEPSRLNLEVKR